jgi:hypothetical protein
MAVGVGTYNYYEYKILSFSIKKLQEKYNKNFQLFHQLFRQKIKIK